MALSASHYLAQLKALLPQGPAWPRDPGSVLSRLLDALSVEFGRVDRRMDELIAEALPQTTVELLDDWERVAGLPDECAADTVKTQTQRRAALLQRLANRGGQSRAYYIALCAQLGYTVSITEFDLHTVESTVDYPIYGIEWIYAWQINVANAQTIFEQTVEDTVDTPFISWGNAEFECLLNHLKPAHTILLFSYAV